VQAALDWRDHMVSGYEDAGQEKWLADRGIALVRGVAGPAWSTWTALATRRSMLSDVIQPFPSFSTIFDSAFKTLRMEIAKMPPPLQPMQAQTARP